MFAGKLYVLTYAAGVTKIYETSTTSYDAVLVGQFDSSEIAGNVNSLFVGGPNIINELSTPLKTVNGLAPVDNLLSIFGCDMISVSQRNNSELTVGITVPDDKLNVTRSEHYE
jgi:hypothetical protein